MDEKKFKVGQVWRTRGGEEAKLIHITGYGGTSEVICEQFIGRDKSGFYFGSRNEHDYDLVELIRDENGNQPVDEQPADAAAPVSPVTPEAEPGVLVPFVDNGRGNNITDIITQGMREGKDAEGIRPYIDLYDKVMAQQ